VFAFDFETRIKTILPLFHWSVAWSVKLCWLLTTFQSDTASAHRCPSLVSDKHVPVYRFQSVFPGSDALVWFSCSQGWKCMMQITVMSCCSNSCCQTSAKLRGDFCFQRTTRAQEHWAAYTRLGTSHQTWPPNRPDLSSVDCRLLRVIQECAYQKQ